MVQFSVEQLPELLAVYYKRLFPYELYHRWLSYGQVNPNSFCNREMSFTLAGEVYIRYQSFDKIEDFEKELIKKIPEKIDIGAIYNVKPRQKRMASTFEVEEKELVFDIDMTDYDSVRTCCSDANVCSKCWKFMAIATRILDAALREDFGFNHILWVFSGRRGIHCWVCDEVARKLDSKVRSDVAEYLQLLTREDHTGKIAHLNSEKIHPSIRRALDIIEKDFESACVECQDILGTPSRMNSVLAMMEDGLRQEVETAWETTNTSLERWTVFKKIFNAQQASNKLKKRNKNLIDELMLHFSYPRLDINVTKGSNHLLKSPFCIHPKTGKVCIPFNPSAVSSFDPNAVPTISDLVEEIQQFDAKQGEAIKKGMKNYRKTSMYKSIQVFEEFLRKLEESWKSKYGGSVESMDF
ncbi:unnamed protein product [Nezara viridula]|uniref:DNA primase n=1 Tax=Nezara viridula TaxID=85310 RepID=A0A9P0HID4_NEZVI|nr:unnamed protein product [Nezara viridula]